MTRSIWADLLLGPKTKKRGTAQRIASRRWQKRRATTTERRAFLAVKNAKKRQRRRCSTCGARPGVVCRTPAGKIAKTPHKARG